ncbi:GLPGLI family protein [Chryseobacterium sp. SSA4.19]|uniref:GLPGLI family protein n=1 Tax=Chryseobacterium sp. SSA4.19 TaxID=2919915 RepID=UPI001F4D54B5|nr:GLPGLI family protein [Chryseobacterium sp. SSA4.19]MCJ8152969.1 GLPGLI family protein [Chryseobacterium sp. SSA4.19]
MKIFIILLFICSLTAGQATRIVYEYSFIPDINDRKTIRSEYMFLDVQQKGSDFYSYRNYSVDSTALAYMNKGLSFMPPNREYIDFRIVKNIGSNEVNMITKVGSVVYEVADYRKQEWKITNQKSEILGHAVTSAEVNFGGRNWIAWFAPDIPFQEGPYKFNGLPGLILKMEDDKKNHIFTATQIKKLKVHQPYPLTENSKPIKRISDSDFKKILTEYRKDPLKNLRGRYPDQTDSEGNFRTGEQVFRDEERLFKERIKKDNNILEIDLLNSTD